MVQIRTGGPTKNLKINKRWGRGGLLFGTGEYKVAFTPMHFVLLELDTHRFDLDFKLLDENNNAITLRTFYLQQLTLLVPIPDKVKKLS